MAAPLSSLIRPVKGPSLAAFERIAPPPAADLIAAEIEARTGTNDIILELHGRGGWVARGAVDRLRRAYTLETTALTGLLAELVLRPPDLRHLDATMAALSSAQRAGIGLRESIEAGFTTICPDCGNPARVEEYVWDGEGDMPSRRIIRCAYCRTPRSEMRATPLSEDDRARARAAMESPARETLLGRFPVLTPDHPLPGELLGLFTPRGLDAIASIIERIEGDLRAPSIQAALRLALVHVILPASRLNGWQGRAGTLRVTGGHVRGPVTRQFRERDPWVLFEEGFRSVRAFVQQLDGSPGGAHHARYGRDLGALLDGSANVVLGHGSVADPRVAPRLPGGAGERAMSRVRLVLTQPPIHWGPESLAFAYLATSLAMGYDAAATLPLEPLFGSFPRDEWSHDAGELRRSLEAVREVLAPNGRVVLLLDPTGRGGLVASVLGGVGAGFRLVDAVVVEAGDRITGTLDFRPPDAPEDEDRDYPDLPDPDHREAFSIRAARAAVTETAVAALQARGEPASEDRLLGEILIGLDRLGYLARLSGARPHVEPAPAPEPERTRTTRERADPIDEELAGGGSPEEVFRSWRDPSRVVRGGTAEIVPAPRRVGGVRSAAVPDAGDDPFAGVLPAPHGRLAAAADGATGSTTPRDAQPADGGRPAGDPSADPVRLTMELIDEELRRPGNTRLVELEPGRWWLRDARDVEAARPPLSDRLEWAVYSLLSTSDGIPEGAFFDRVAGMFRGYDAPDEEMVRACLESHGVRDPGPDGLLRALDPLRARHEEHGIIVGRLAELGHRLGMRVWISRREQRRLYRGHPLGELLTEAERRTYLPLVHPGPPEVLDATDCIWYIRGRLTFLFEVEWTAMLDDPVIRRGGRIPTTDSLVRFLVVPPERADLVRLKLERSPLLRRRLAEDNWHIVKSDHLGRLLDHEDTRLEDLGPILGLDPEIERDGGQLSFFE